jgi:hypothetical protein
MRDAEEKRIERKELGGGREDVLWTVIVYSAQRLGRHGHDTMPHSANLSHSA